MATFKMTAVTVQAKLSSLFPHVYNKVNNNTCPAYLRRLLWKLKRTAHVNTLSEIEVSHTWLEIAITPQKFTHSAFLPQLENE